MLLYILWKAIIVEKLNSFSSDIRFEIICLSTNKKYARTSRVKTFIKI